MLGSSTVARLAPKRRFLGTLLERGVRNVPLSQQHRFASSNRPFSSLATIIANTISTSSQPFDDQAVVRQNKKSMLVMTRNFSQQESIYSGPNHPISRPTRSRHNNKNNNNRHHNHQSRPRRQRKDPDLAAQEKDSRRTTKRVLQLGEEVKHSASSSSSSSSDNDKGGLSTPAFRKILRERSFWVESEKAIGWWTKQHTNESLAMSFRMLDALADLSGLAQEPQLSGPILQAKVLNSLVQNWMIAAISTKQQPTTPGATNEDYSMTPPEMFKKLEDYRINSRTTSTTRRKLRPNLETYQILMEAAAIGSTGLLPPGFNESIVRHLMEQGKTDSDIDPDLKTVAHILHGWSVRGQLISMEELTGVLDLLEEFVEKDEKSKRDNDNHSGNSHDNKGSTDSSVQPRTVRLFNEALFAIARSNSNRKSSRGAEKMLSVLHFMEFMADGYPDHGAELHPTVDTYDLVLNGFARAGNGAQAEMVLQHMVQRYSRAHGSATNSSNQPTDGTAITNVVSKATSGALSVAPLAKSFTIAITAFGNSEERYAAEKAEGILRWQQRLNDDGAGPLSGRIPLETLTYNNVMRAWSWRRSDKAVEKCDSLRREMSKGKVATDQQTYGQSLKAIALSNLREKGRPAVQVWREMEINGLKANDYAQNYFEKCVAAPRRRRFR